MIKIGNYVVKRTISWLRAILQFCMSISVRQPQQSWSQIAKKKKKNANEDASRKSKPY